MKTELPTTNAQGVFIRSEKYPLKPGDTFRLYSGQVEGTYRGFTHTAIPGEYRIVTVHGTHAEGLVLLRSDYVGADQFTCSTHGVHAILTDEWSNYRKAEQ